MSEISALLDASIEAEAFRIPVVREGPSPRLIDISSIDFEALAKVFKQTAYKNVERQSTIGGISGAPELRRA